LLSNPDLVSHNPVAVLSAGWFWDTRKLNIVSDTGDVERATKLINGGTIGLKERSEHFHHIVQVLQSL
jgi:putative chitinase